MMIIHLLSISLLVGVIYANISLGAGITFRILGVPDLTLEGGGMLAGASTVLVLNAGGGALGGIAAAVAAGAAAGGLTSLIRRLGLGSLLSGLVAASLLYSFTFHVTSGRANVRLDDSVSTVFEVLGDAKSLPATLGVASGLSAMTLVGMSLLFRSRLGFDLRALGEQPALVVRLGRSPAATEAAGLVISNAVIGFGVGLLVCYRRVYDANLLSGLLLSTLGALMLGEAVLRPRTMQGFLLAAGLGSLVSSLLTAIALADWSDRWSAWFSATDTRALMGLLILVSASISARRPGAVIFRSSW